MPEAAIDVAPDLPVLPGDPRVVQLAVGTRHTCALQARGTVYCWGSNSNGQLGDGTTRTVRRAPVRVMGVDDATQIAAGQQFTCALRRDGTVLCWGANAEAQMGDGARGADRPLPAPVAGVAEVTQLTAGAGHACALRRDASVLCWGWNRFAQVGDGTEGGHRRAARVPGLTSVVQIDAGWSHTCARRSDGSVVCWGFNEAGQIGDGTRGDTANRSSPTAVMGLRNALEVAAGATRSVARTAPDELWVWGRNEEPFRLDQPVPVPTRFGTFTGLAQLAPSASFTCVRLESGRVQCWGRGDLGSLGNGNNRDQVMPTEVAMLDDAVEIAAGDFHVCARRRGGSLVCWGSNSDGALGSGTMEPRSLVPVAVLPMP
jgi:alpha-tubulin suppressor-like RCC1 family protein